MNFLVIHINAMSKHMEGSVVNPLIPWSCCPVCACAGVDTCISCSCCVNAVTPCVISATSLLALVSPPPPPIDDAGGGGVACTSWPELKCASTARIAWSHWGSWMYSSAVCLYCGSCNLRRSANWESWCTKQAVYEAGWWQTDKEITSQ